MDVKDIIKEALFLSEDTELTDNTGPKDIDAWDSLGHVNIVTVIEDEFDIEISPDEIGEIRNIGDIKRLLAEKEIGIE